MKKNTYIALSLALSTLVLNGCHRHPDDQNSENLSSSTSSTPSASHSTAPTPSTTEQSVSGQASGSAPQGAISGAQQTNGNTTHSSSTTLPADAQPKSTPLHSGSPGQTSNERRPLEHRDQQKETAERENRQITRSSTVRRPGEEAAREQEKPLHAGDCTSSHWTRVTCKNNNNACIARQIDLMGLYDRCRKAGLLQH